MEVIIIDINVIDKKNYSYFGKDKILENSLNNFIPGLIIITKSDILDKLSVINPGKERVDYINNNDFIRNIHTYYYIIYNRKKGICILDSDCGKYISNILPALFLNFPKETLFWVGIDIKNNTSLMNTFISHGFKNPYVTSLSPLYKNIPISVALTIQKNDNNSDNNLDIIFKELSYSIEQYKNNKKTCYLYAQLSKDTISYLKKIPHTGGIIKNKSQKEVSGELYVKDIKMENKNFIYLIDVNKKSIEVGEEENVQVAATRYNFHSHPKEAYVRYSVNKAWPSVVDFLGFHKLGDNTIFHCVVTIEGIYVISFSPFWATNIKKIDRKFIDKNFEIDHKNPYTPKQFTDIVNNILYKKYPIFEVQYFSWKKSNTIFKVFFPKITSSCLSSQKSVENYKRLYN